MTEQLHHVWLASDDFQWSSFVDSHPEATLFHHPAWSKLLAEAYGYHPLVLAMKDDSGQICAGIPMMEINRVLTPRRFVSLPFSDYCAPLGTAGGAIPELINCLAGLYQKQKSSIEIRWPIVATSPCDLCPMFVIHKLTFPKGCDGIIETFEKKFRQYCRKADREGLHVVSTGNCVDMDEFYLLHVKTRVKLGVPVQPKRWFEGINNILISKGLGSVIIVADKNNQPVSGAIVLAYNQKAMIKYSASDPASLGTRCHYYIFWKCIEWAYNSGMTEIDFGRTDVSDEGLRKFKNGWAAKEVSLAYFYIGSESRNLSGSAAVRLLRNLIRRSPDVVCRAVGKLFYGYLG